MYYKISYDKDIFEENPGLRAVEEYAKLSDKQMKFVILVCDPSHDNPVRTRIGKDRREKAAILAGYKMETDGKRLDRNARAVANGEVPSIEKAIAKFQELHFNEKQDLLESMESQISEIRDFLKEKKGGDPKKLKAAIEFGTKLPELVEAKLKLESTLNASLNQKPEFEPSVSAGIEIVNNAGADDELGEQALSTIDKIMMEQQRRKE